MPAAIAEYEMARAALRAGAAIVLPAVLYAETAKGPAGGMTALVGVAFVVGWFALVGLSLGWAAERNPGFYQAVAFGGFAVRLGVFALAIPVLTPVQAIDGTVLAVTVAVSIVVLLTAEVRFVLRRSDLWWVAPNRIPTRLEEAMRDLRRAPAENGKERA